MPMKKEELIKNYLHKLAFNDCKKLLKEKGLWKMAYNLASEEQLKNGILEKAMEYSQDEVERFLKNL